MATATKERPILFSGPMVAAILGGRKTQTRRVVKGVSGKGELDPDFSDDFPKAGLDRVYFEDGHAVFEYQTRVDDTDKHCVKCPYGSPGDRLYCKETFAPRLDVDPVKDPEKARHYALYRANGTSLAETHWHSYPSRWTPSIHMPRWASRITLKITEVRVERLQAISEEDAITEGFDVDTCGRVLRQAAGKARMDFGRWLEMPDGSEPDGYWCLSCVDKEAKKRGASVRGWNDCYENDHAPRCEKCGVMLHHSLTRYGIQTELGLTNEDETRIHYTPSKGDSALALAELAEGMGDWSDEYAGRLAQIGFGTAWDKLNAKRGFPWASNPWVWAITFKRITEAGA